MDFFRKEEQVKKGEDRMAGVPRVPTGMSRKHFLGGLGSVAAMLAMGACGPGGSGESEALVRWINEESDPETLEWINEVIKEYTKETGVQVEQEVAGPAGSAQTALRAIKEGRSYDLAPTYFATYTLYGEEGYLRPLDKVIEALGGEDAFVPGALPKINGTIGMVPYDFGHAFTFYRKDWLEEIGEDVPRTWDQMKTVAQKFTTGDRYGIVQPLAMGEQTNYGGTNILWSNGVEFFDEDWNVILDQGESKERCVQCLEFLKELQPYMPPGMLNVGYDGLINNFVNETAGITVYGGRLVHALEDNAPELADPDKFVMTGYPTPDGEKLTITAGFDGWSVLDPGANAEAAEKFLTWMMSEKLIDFLLTLPIHYQPALKSVYENERWRSNPLVQKHHKSIEFMRSIPMGISDEYIATNIDLITPGLGQLKAEISNNFVIPEMYQKVIVDNADPGKAVDEAAALIREFAKE